jgi:hypothetical protein
VADEDNGLAVVSEPADILEEFVRLGGGEHGRRLIEH